MFQSEKMLGLELEKQMFFEYDGEESPDITNDYELRKFMFSPDSTPIMYLDELQAVGAKQIKGLTLVGR